ncbi:hypothetical protein TIFTF001_033645 [Ficus carica]|uniref:Uncharacterized protein n=1 Tax=Ficus carica TaxID=3494 RepID=A0AA88DYW1_FICCA|nr:hypothetical protein TIFTF001_033645 [Ficus carica]
MFTPTTPPPSRHYSLPPYSLTRFDLPSPPPPANATATIVTELTPPLSVTNRPPPPVLLLNWVLRKEEREGAKETPTLPPSY